MSSIFEQNKKRGIRNEFSYIIENVMQYHTAICNLFVDLEDKELSAEVKTISTRFYKTDYTYQIPVLKLQRRF
jgi:hypothetical protein